MEWMSPMDSSCSSVSLGQKRTPSCVVHACPNGAGSVGTFTFAEAIGGNTSASVAAVSKIPITRSPHHPHTAQEIPGYWRL